MKTLKGFQIKMLKGLAHHLKPAVLIGKGGLSDALIASVDQALNDHELIKIKFNDFKDEKDALSRKIEERTHSQRVAVIGNIAILYRAHPEEEKRKIKLPQPPDRDKPSNEG